MSHGASGGFADVVTPNNVCKVFPDLEPLFKAVTSHEAWGLLEGCYTCHFDNINDVRSELCDVLEMEEDETDQAYDKRVNVLAKSFREAFRKLQVSFRSRTGAEIDTDYLDEESLDGYAEVSGRYWYIYDHEQIKPKVAKAQKKGLKIERSFYAVYG
jgi:hypothetical protein